MAFLPDGPFAVAALVLIAGGLAAILRPGVPKAYGMGVLIMAVFLLDTAARLFAGTDEVTSQLGFVASAFLRGETWWSPVTSIFTHAPPGGRGGFFFNIHALGNLLVLVAAGPPLEDRMGERRFLFLFLGGALVALVVHTLLAYFTPITFPSALALGASGGLFAVLTAFAVRYPREPLPILLLFFLVRMPASGVLLVYLGINFVYMFTSAAGVAWWGHFAGAAVGLAYAARLPADEGALRRPDGGGAMPDPEKLAPLATTPETRRILERLRQFTPETRTADDRAYADAWVDKLLAKASCPTCGEAFRRDGMQATCLSGETTVAFEK